MITVVMFFTQWNDECCQRNQKCSDFQQITKCNKTIQCNHLPSVPMSSGSKNQKKTWPPTVSGMPSAFYYITLREKCQTLIRLQIAKKASPQQHISKKRARLTVCSLFLFQNHVDIPRRITPPEMSVWSPCPAPVRCWRKLWHGEELPRAWR